jgi:hypothetical protein
MCQAATRKIHKNYAHRLFTPKITTHCTAAIQATTSCGHLNFKSAIRRDQRALCFTSPADGRPCFPHDHAGSVPQKARSSRAASCGIERSACFRLRFADGRFAPAAFLRLCASAPLSRSSNRRPKLDVFLPNSVAALVHRAYAAYVTSGNLRWT